MLTTFCSLTYAQTLTVNYTTYNVSCNGAADGAIYTSVSGGTAPYYYSWTSGQTTDYIQGLAAGVYALTVIDSDTLQLTGSVTIIVTQPMAISISTGSQNSMCGNADGSASITVSGGTPPYAYSWNTGTTTQTVTSLIAGTYNATVTDANGCKEVAYVTVNDIAGLTTVLYQSGVSCNGGNDGSAIVSVGGGSAPYAYMWSHGATTADAYGLFAGTYIFSVTDANGCSGIEYVVITEPVALSLLLTSGPTCSGSCIGSIDVQASGGVGFYSYIWSNGDSLQSISGLCAGGYTVSIIDANGCMLGGTTTVQSDSNSASITINNVSCFGGNDGSISVSGCGVAPFTYDWSNGVTTSNISSLTAGTFTVTITDANSVQNVQTISVTEPVQLSVTVSPQDVTCNSVCDGVVYATPNGGAGGYSYAWSTGATASNVFSMDQFNLCAGTYAVTITDANGCSDVGFATVNEPSLLVVTATVTGDGCDSLGATIDLTVSGGTSPYSFMWSDGSNSQSLSGVFSGNYDAVVMDANFCGDSSNMITVTGANFSVGLNITDVSLCGSGDGSAYVSVIGSSGPFTYAWSNGATGNTIANIPAGTHTVIVSDSSGCSASASGTLSILSCSGIISGQVFEDENGNGVMDSNEVGINGIYVYTYNNGYYWSYTNHDGNYAIQVNDTGNYTVYVYKPYRYSCSGGYYQPMTVTTPTSGSYSVSVTASNLVVSGNDFGLQDPSADCGTISGQIYNDLNGNGTLDSGEPPMAGVWVYFDPWGYAQTDAAGFYSYEVPLNTAYTIYLTYSSSYYYYCPSSAIDASQITEPANETYTITLSSSTPDTTGIDFGIKQAVTLDAGFYSLRTQYGYTPGDDFRGWMDFKIYTDFLATCTLTVHKDPLLTLLNATLQEVEVTDTTITWIETVEGYDFFHCMHMDYHLDAAAPDGYELYWWAEIGCDVDDYCDLNNRIDRWVTVGGGNGKTGVAENGNNKIYLFHTGDQDTDIITTDDSTFSYEISYHNTSGDTVFSMVILDTLPDYLDPASVSKPFSPHHPEFTIIEPNILYFAFEDIVLPDSSMDKLGSYGFVQFNVNMKPNLAPGTQIDNHATIIFNNKDQLTTNTVSVTIEDTASTTVNELDIKKLGISIYPNPAKDRLNINMNELSVNSKFVLYNVAGEVVDYQTITNRETSIDVSKYPQGVYFINVNAFTGINRNR